MRAFLIAFLLCFFVLQAPAQTNNVTFLHGLEGDASSWTAADQYLKNQLPLTTKRFTYSSNTSIENIAATHYGTLLDNSIVISHSMGGLVGREMVRNHPEGDVRALITVGVPHTGAQAAMLVDSPIAGQLIEQWVYDMLIGPFIVVGGPSPLTQFVLDVIISPVDFFLYQLINEDFDVAATQDLQPGSAFLQTLNSNPSSTFPTPHYTLETQEQWPSYLRMAESSSKQGVETGEYALAAEYLANVYLGLALGWFGEAQYWLNEYIESRDPRDYDRYYRALAAARGFERGYFSLTYFQPVSWEFVVTGAITANGSETSDALVKSSSQAPTFVTSERRILLPDAFVNHLEQTSHPRMHTLLDETLRRDDIEADEVPPFTAAIEGPATLDIGETGTWSVNTVNGVAPYSYAWEYSIDCRDPNPAPDCGLWQPGGTGPELTLSFQDHHFLNIRVTVTNGYNTTAVATQPVTVGQGEPPAPLNVAITGPDALSVGATGTWSRNVSGGTQPYTYSWDYNVACPPQMNTPNCGEWSQSQGGATFSFSYNQNATVEIRLTVSDAADVVAITSRTITIGSGAPLAASLDGPTTIAPSTTGYWSATVAGGTSPYTYRWDFRDWCRDLSGTNAASGDGDGDPLCTQQVPDWEYGGNGTSFSRQRRPGYDLEIRLTVIDESNATVVDSVMVKPLGGVYP
jgi:pimeloyl-ACP methyl ester carboxylesterase